MIRRRTRLTAHPIQTRRTCVVTGQTQHIRAIVVVFGVAVAGLGGGAVGAEFGGLAGAAVWS